MLFLGFKVLFNHRVHYSKAIISVCHCIKIEISCFSLKHKRETFANAFLRDSNLVAVVVVDVDLCSECLIILSFILNVILVVIDLY
jgi:hypothetical protein